MIIKAPIIERSQQIAAVAFVGNTDFVTSGNDAEYKIQAIIDLYNKYYTAIGGYIEHSKIVFYA